MPLVALLFAFLFQMELQHVSYAQADPAAYDRFGYGSKTFQSGGHGCPFPTSWPPSPPTVTPTPLPRDDFSSESSSGVELQTIGKSGTLVVDQQGCPELYPNCTHNSSPSCQACAPVPECPGAEWTVGSTMKFDFKFVDIHTWADEFHSVALVQKRGGSNKNAIGLTNFQLRHKSVYQLIENGTPVGYLYAFRRFMLLTNAYKDKKQRVLVFSSGEPETVKTNTSHYAIERVSYQFGLHLYYHSAVFRQNDCTDQNTTWITSGSATQTCLDRYIRMYWVGWFRFKNFTSPPQAPNSGPDSTFVLAGDNLEVQECLTGYADITELQGGMYYGFKEDSPRDDNIHIHTEIHKRYYVKPQPIGHLPHSQNFMGAWCSHLFSPTSSQCPNIDTSVLGVPSMMGYWTQEWDEGYIKKWDLAGKGERDMIVFNIGANQWDVCTGVVPNTPCLCPPKAASDRVLILVQGYIGLGPGSGGESCNGKYGRLKADFVRWGWNPNNIYTVGLYDGDPSSNSGCSINLKDFPSHGSHPAHLTKNDGIDQLGWRFAWMLYEKPEFHNADEIDIVAYSMGGLVVQYALAAASFRQYFPNAEFQIGSPYKVYPPTIPPIYDVVTVGSPLNGFHSVSPLSPSYPDVIAGLAAFGCVTQLMTQQCWDMLETSALMRALTTDRRTSNGAYFRPTSPSPTVGGVRTEWTNVMSDADIVKPLSTKWEQRGARWVAITKDTHSILHVGGSEELPDQYHTQEIPELFYFNDSSWCGDHEITRSSDFKGGRMSRWWRPHVNYEVDLSVVQQNR